MNIRYGLHVIIILNCIFSITACKQPAGGDYKHWSTYNGTKEGLKYSSLSRIDTGNVQQLTVAWTYHTGDADTVNHSQIQCNPVIVHGIMYATSPQLKLFALDAATGKPRWVFDPLDSSNVPAVNFILNNCRGVTYWEEGSDKRIFYTAGAELYAINAATGKPVPAFGHNGRIDLHEGLGANAQNLYVTSTTPGIIYKDQIIVGTRVSEGSDAAPGHIRSYDVRTGKQRWIFHTIPHPGEDGYDSWKDPEAYKHIGGANCWSGFSLDEKRGILYAPVGSASFDFYGGRRKGDNLFADCLLALDAGTGKHLWHFQDIHHNVWDRDLPAPPVLLTVNHGGKRVDAVAQTTKTGFVFLLDRETGQPLFPVTEKPVPQLSELQGEELSPTQPYPSLPRPFARQSVTEQDLNNLLPDSSYQDIKQKWASYHTDHMFNPPSMKGTLVMPGFDGGGEWGGPAVDPVTGVLYVNANEMANVLHMVSAEDNKTKRETNLAAGKKLYRQHCMSCHGPDRHGTGNFPSLLQVNKKYNESRFLQLITTGRRMMPAFKQLATAEKKAIASFVLELKNSQEQAYTGASLPLDTFRHLPYNMTGYNKFLSREGYPGIKPPWGTLSAIDMNTGEYLWKNTLGEYPEFKARGIITGTENYGGPAVTAGGLLFIAATRDSKLRAFNKRTGKLLWEAILPAPGFATPAVFEANGRQYIVIACGGGKLGTASGDAYIAYTLP